MRGVTVEVSPKGQPAAALQAQASERSDPLRTAGYALVLVAVPLVTCNALRAGENANYGDVPLGLATVFLLGSWLRHGVPRGVIPAGVPLGALLLLAAGALAIVPAENLDSMLPSLRFGITLGLMPLVIMFATTTPRRLQALVDLWLLAAAANSVVAALDLFGGTNIGLSLTSIDYVGITERATGLTNHPNHLGLVAAMALPVAVARLGAGGWRALAALGLVPLLLVGVFASGSRGAFIAAAAGVVILFAFGAATRRLRTTLLLFGVPVVAFVVLIAVIGNNELLTGSVTVERLAGGGGATLSDNARRVTLSRSLGEALENPLVGDGFEEVRTAHNIYVQLLQAGGILALIGFATFAIAVVRRARRLSLASSGSPPWLMTLAAANGASIYVWLLFGMVGTAVYDRYLYVPVGVVLALGLIHRRRFAAREPPQAGSSPPSPPSRMTRGAPNRPPLAVSSMRDGR